MFNFKNYFNVSEMNKVLVLILKFYGVVFLGKVLKVVRMKVFDGVGRMNEFGVLCVFLYIICGKLVDDVVGLVKVFKEVKVKIVVVGVCFEVNKMEFCNIGSFLVCNNFVFINIFKLLNIFGKELVNKLK